VNDMKCLPTRSTASRLGGFNITATTTHSIHQMKRKHVITLKDTLTTILTLIAMKN
jgi:hypothetical protein